MITVVPNGGLCNRLRCIKSTLNLAKKLNQPVRVYWRVNGELNCRYEDLFEPCDLFKVRNVYKEKCLKAVKKMTGMFLRAYGQYLFLDAGGKYNTCNWSMSSLEDRAALEQYVQTNNIRGGTSAPVMTIIGLTTG